MISEVQLFFKDYNAKGEGLRCLLPSIDFERASWDWDGGVFDNRPGSTDLHRVAVLETSWRSLIILVMSNTSLSLEVEEDVPGLGSVGVRFSFLGEVSLLTLPLLCSVFAGVRTVFGRVCDAAMKVAPPGPHEDVSVDSISFRRLKCSSDGDLSLGGLNVGVRLRSSHTFGLYSSVALVGLSVVDNGLRDLVPSATTGARDLLVDVSVLAYLSAVFGLHDVFSVLAVLPVIFGVHDVLI